MMHSIYIYIYIFFFFLQANFPEVSDSELKGMDGKIAELQKKVEQSQSECKQLELRKTYYTLHIKGNPHVCTLCLLGLSSLNSSLTSEQAKDKLKAVEKEVTSNYLGLPQGCGIWVGVMCDFSTRK